MLSLVLLLFRESFSLPPDCSAPIHANTDVVNPVRSLKYPDGLSSSTINDCCAACDGASDCLGYVYAPNEKYCYPLSGYDGIVGGVSDREFGGAPPAPPPPPSPPPADWAARVAAHDMLYSPSDISLNPSHFPEIGNGFLAMQVMNPAIFVAGLFNGYLTKDPSHRARLPATNAIKAPGTPGPAALDIREATYYRRSSLSPSPPGTCTAAALTSCSNAPANITIEQRWYAHRSRPSVLIHEVQILPSTSPPPPPP